jgi:predicted transcriptional regulator
MAAPLHLEFRIPPLTGKETLAKRLDLLADYNGGRFVFSVSVGIPYQTFYKYTKGANPSSSAITRICERSGISPNWLLLGESSNDFTTIKTREDLVSRASKRFAIYLSKLIGDEEVEQFAQRAGISARDIREILGGSEPTITELVKLSAAAGFTLDKAVKEIT